MACVCKSIQIQGARYGRGSPRGQQGERSKEDLLNALIGGRASRPSACLKRRPCGPQNAMHSMHSMTFSIYILCSCRQARGRAAEAPGGGVGGVRAAAALKVGHCPCGGGVTGCHGGTRVGTRVGPPEEEQARNTALAKETKARRWTRKKRGTWNVRHAPRDVEVFLHLQWPASEQDREDTCCLMLRLGGA